MSMFHKLAYKTMGSLLLLNCLDQLSSAQFSRSCQHSKQPFKVRMIKIDILDVMIHCQKVFHEFVEVLFYQGTVPAERTKKQFVCHQFYRLGWKQVFAIVRSFWSGHNQAKSENVRDYVIFIDHHIILHFFLLGQVFENDILVQK